MRLILRRHYARRSPLHVQARCIRSVYALLPARITRGGRGAATCSGSMSSLRASCGPRSAKEVQNVARGGRARRFRVLGA